MERLQQLSDRLELQQLVTEYTYAIDERDFDRLDRVFTPDAYIDYRAMGGIDGPYPKVKAWLPQALKPFPAFLHFIGNLWFEIDSDEARGKIQNSNAALSIPGASLAHFVCIDVLHQAAVAGELDQALPSGDQGAFVSATFPLASASCMNPMVVPTPEGGSDTMFLGLWYHDRYRRTAEGWRIVERVEHKCYDFNMPLWMKQALKL